VDLVPGAHPLADQRGAAGDAPAQGADLGARHPDGPKHARVQQARQGAGVEAI